MKNPYFIDERAAAFQEAAAAVADYLAKNPQLEDVAEVDLMQVTEVRAVFDKHKGRFSLAEKAGLPEGYRAEIRQRVAVLVAADSEIEGLAQQAAAVDRRAVELLTR